MSSKSHLKKDKIDLAMSGLQKLKQEIASVEAKYRILNEDYTIICDEALTRINGARFPLEEQTNISIQEPSQNNIVAYETITGTEFTALSRGISAHNNDKKPDTVPVPHNVQSAEKTPAVDCVANYIEIGLDKLGDALVFPFVITTKLYNKITGTKSTK